MAYNNGFPATYQPYYPQYQAYQQPAQQSGIIWVSGEAGAKAYLVAPNTTVQLWDSEAQRIFLKSADASGMPSMKVLDYTIRETAQSTPVARQPVQTDKSPAYATKDEIDGILSKLEALRAEVDKIKEAERDE